MSQVGANLPEDPHHRLGHVGNAALGYKDVRQFFSSVPSMVWRGERFLIAALQGRQGFQSCQDCQGFQEGMESDLRCICCGGGPSGRDGILRD